MGMRGAVETGGNGTQRRPHPETAERRSTQQSQTLMSEIQMLV